MARLRARFAACFSGPGRWAVLGVLLCVLPVTAALVVTARASERQAEAHRAQLDLLRDERSAQRFTEAVDQLGRRDELAVRIGAIHTLAQLMRDSPRDQKAIVDILGAFVRSHADTKPIPPPSGSHADHRSSPPDVIAAFVALANRPFVSLDDSGEVDVHGVYMSLPDRKLLGAHLEGAELRGAILTWSELDGAGLDKAGLQGANLENASLRGASLRGALLNGANLTFTTLVRATLAGADLSGADLTGAYLDETDLRRANLTGARATESELLCAVVDERTRLPAGVDPTRIGPASPGCVARKFDRTPQPDVSPT